MSTTPRKYEDKDGNPCPLLRLIKSEPEWAENQILHRDRLEAELAAFSKGYVDSAQHNNIAKKLAAVTAERDALKAKLATINHIAMSLFVRATNSEVTGEMAEIGRLLREDGK